MSRDTAKGFYDKNPGDPESGYVTPADAQAALDVVYDDMQADVGGADAINTKIGAAPQGSNSTVQERLEQIEAGANLAAQSVTSDKIANGTIVDADVNAGAAIAPGKIAGTAVTRSDTGTVTSAMIENGTILNGDINAAAAIDKSKIAGVAVTRADVDAIPASMLEDGSITNAKVANNAAIDKAKIAGTAIVSTDSGVVTTGMIADGTIVNGDINPSANIDPAKIAGTAVTQGQSGSVTGPMIANGTISDAQINANAAIGKGKIAGVAVTQADSATVSGAMIKQNTVTGSNLVNDTITATQIAANAVGSSKLADNAVDTAAIQDGAVTSAKIADGTVTATDVAASTFAAFGTVGNLLTANQATPTGTGLFILNACTEGAAGVFTADSTSFYAARYNISTGITPGETYTFTANLAPTGRAMYVYVLWFEAGPGLGLGAAVGNTIAAGSSGVSKVTAVAPAGAGYARFYAAYSSTGSAGDSVTVTKIGLWKGASGQWAMPGTPIVGGSHIATNGAVHLSGTGTPESVITAAPGSTWLQTDSTTDVKGWIRWVKATGTGSTGWVAGPEADTGTRLVAVDGPSWSGNVHVRRRGNIVEVKPDTSRLTMPAAGTDLVMTLPSGFRAIGSGFTDGMSFNHVTNYVFPILMSSGGAIYYYASTSRSAGNTLSFTLVFQTADAWPTSLPGTAV